MENPIEIACRACASQPGDQCRTPRLDVIEYQEIFHEERVTDAASVGEPPLSPHDRMLEVDAVDKVAEQMF